MSPGGITPGRHRTTGLSPTTAAPPTPSSPNGTGGGAGSVALAGKNCSLVGPVGDSSAFSGCLNSVSGNVGSGSPANSGCLRIDPREYGPAP